MGQQEGEAENRSSITIAKRERSECWKEDVGGVTESQLKWIDVNDGGRRKLSVQFEAREAQRY